MIISKPNNKDLTYLVNGPICSTMAAIDLSKYCLIWFNEHEDYEGINEFFGFGISCGFFRKEKIKES